MHKDDPDVPTGASRPTPNRTPKRERCRTCGERLGRKWGPDRTTLVRFCENASCEWFGIPSLRHVKTVVVVEDDGKVRERHKEAYSHRGSRPDFVQPA